MNIKPVYLYALIGYLTTISAIYYFFGTNLAGLAALAGILGPAIGLLNNAIDSSEKEERPEPEHEQQPYVESLEDRKERAITRLSDHVTLRETTTGEIEVFLESQGIQGVDREAMLYVFGKWARAESDPELSPLLTKLEIRENTSLKGRSVGVFLDKMAHYIERYYPEDPVEQYEMDEGEMEFELNEDYLEEIVEYILGERPAPN